MRPQRRLVIGGVTATVLSGGAAGLLLLAPSLANAAGPVAEIVAQAPPTTEPDSTDAEATSTETTPIEDDTAEDEAVDETEEVTARSDGLRALLQPLVDDGTLTAEQADAVVAELEAVGRPGIWVDGPMIIHGEPGQMGFPDMGQPIGPAGPGQNGPGQVGPERPDVPDLSIGRRLQLGAFSVDVVADAIGIELADLMSQIRDGATVAEIATAAGVDPQTVIDALVDHVSDHLAVGVDEGSITEDDAATYLAKATERITEFVNGEQPTAPEPPTATESDTDETATTPPDETVTDVTETTTSA